MVPWWLGPTLLIILVAIVLIIVYLALIFGPGINNKAVDTASDDYKREMAQLWSQRVNMVPAFSKAQQTTGPLAGVATYGPEANETLNHQALGTNLAKKYGPEIGQAYSDILAEHAVIIIVLIDRLNSGCPTSTTSSLQSRWANGPQDMDGSAAAQCSARPDVDIIGHKLLLDTNRDRVTELLCSADPAFNRQTMRQLWDNHNNALLAEAKHYAIHGYEPILIEKAGLGDLLGGAVGSMLGGGGLGNMLGGQGGLGNMLGGQGGLGNVLGGQGGLGNVLGGQGGLGNVLGGQGGLPTGAGGLNPQQAVTNSVGQLVSYIAQPH